MHVQMRIRGRQLAAFGLAAATAAAGILPASAAEPIGDGVAPTYDEAYYATLDYYGNLTEGSVVKSYTLNGAASITDYGTYDSVNNLTDGTLPSVSGGRTVFDFGGDAPSHFYFEGRTTQPFQNLPWTISMSYQLNGVPTRAEDLAGKTGVVEIALDFVPNENASDYARHNYTLEAMAIFNQDDILSLKAEGAQVQLIGNLRVVLFLCLPGEEQHFTIQVGSDDFSFSGMTFLMVPATLSQLEQIADLSQKKDDLEEDYHKLSGSLDDLLSAMDSMTGSLQAAASGLDALNQARGTFSAGKGVLYDGTDLLKGDLGQIALLLDPVEEQIQILSQTVTDSKAVLNSILDTTVSLKRQLKDMEEALENLEDGTGDVQSLLQSAADMKNSLGRLRRALNDVSGGASSGEGSGEDSTSSRALVKQVKAVHSAYEERDLSAFMAKMLVLNGTAGSSAEASAMVQQLLPLLDIPEEVADQLLPQQKAYWKSARELKALYDAAGVLSFQQFCELLPDVSKEQAKQMNDLWIIYSSGEVDSETEEPSLSVPGIGGEEAHGSGEEISQSLFASLLLNDPNDGSDGESSGPSESPDSGPSEGGASGEGVGSGGEAGEGAGEETGDDTSPEESSTVGGAAIDLITGGLDSAMSSIDSIKSELTSTLRSIARPTASVVGDLAGLCNQLDDLTDLLDDAANLSSAVRSSSKKIREILDDSEELRVLLNDYEPTLQESLHTVGILSTTAASTVRDTISLIDSAEDLLRRSGTQLDSGTEATLKSLSETLRRTADVMAASGSIKTAKDAMTDIVEDLWNDHTGDVDNLLLMDATAQAESLTDPRNGTPQSVQVLIRSQEIKAEEPEAPEEAAQTAAGTTFWGRVAQMFKDFWNAITGIFQK